MARKQLNQIPDYRVNSTPERKEKFRGMVHAVWTGADNFLDLYYGEKENKEGQEDQAGCFKALFDAIKEVQNDKAR